MPTMAKGPIALYNGVQIFEAGKGFKEAFKKWKAETEKKGRLEIMDTPTNEGIVVIAWKVYDRPRVSNISRKQ